MIDRNASRRMRGLPGDSSPLQKSRIRRRNAQFDTLEERTLMAVGFLTGPQEGHPLAIVMNYLSAHGSDYGLSAGDLSTLRVTNMYTDSAGAKSTHIYMRQTLDALTVEGADLSIGVTTRGEIISIGGSFVDGLSDRATGQVPVPALSAIDTLITAAAAMGLTPNGQPQILEQKRGIDQQMVIMAPGISQAPIDAYLTYIAAPGAPLTWNFTIEVTAPMFQVYDINADATTGALVDVGELVDYASYNVFALPTANPDAGPRTLLTDPADPKASPFGWHDTNGAPGAEFTDTRGNNVDAFTDINATFSNVDNVSPSEPRPDGGASLNFDSPLDLSKDPANYRAASVISLFVLNNRLHDIYFQYGFDEAAGNAQMTNYSGQGVGGDPLKAVDSFGFSSTAYRDNAFMYTPADGKSPVMAMFVFDLTNPNRTSSIDAEVAVHENGHYVSNRLTGGPANAGALGGLQSGGMGEGWSDYLAMLTTFGDSPPTRTSVRATGNYVLGLGANGGGIRRYPYSYNMNVNPLTLGSFNGGYPNNEVHNAGEIWCQVLLDMTVLLIEKHGYDPALAKGYTGPTTAGNIVALQLVLDGMKLQPANPTFLQARDAILNADIALTGGENVADIWSAFARRGFGLSASAGANADSTVVVEAKDQPVFVTMALTAPTGVKENQAYTNVQVATFTDGNPQAPTFYSATVDWGDGSVVQGQIVKTGTTSFSVRLPQKMYQEGGSYTLTVTLVKPGSITLVKSGTVKVADLPITAAIGTIAATKEGDAFTGVIGTFDDSLDPDTIGAEMYSVAIQWGDDGTSSPGSVEVDTVAGRNHFIVKGTHVFGGGLSTVVMTVTGPGQGTASAQTQVDVEDSPLDSTGLAVAPVEGKAFDSPLAFFTDADPRRPGASNYFATIDWGDGVQTTGLVKADPLNPRFYVYGTHAYDYRVAPYPLTVKIGNHTGKNTTTAVASAKVTDAPLKGNGFSYSTGAGQDLTKFFASFSDTDPRNHPVGHYSATINWGDGQTTPGQIVINSDGGYLVKATHAYAKAQAQPYTYTASITNQPGDPNNILTITGKVTVAPAPLSVAVLTTAPLVEDKELADVAVARITTSNALAESGDFRATIIWGDNTSTNDARIVNDPRGSGFLVLSTATTGVKKSFDQPGSYNITVFVTTTGAQAGAAGAVTVKDAPLHASPATLPTAESKTPISNLLVASFTDDDRTPNIGDFSAKIRWGDGTPDSDGQIVANNRGGFDVYAPSHSFGRSGTYPITVDIASRFGSTTSTQSTANVTAKLFPISGSLTAGAGPGLSQGVTSSATPTLSGTSEPGAIVTVYAKTAGNEAKLIATTVADGSGRWSTTTKDLTDGTYSLEASAVDTLGEVSSKLAPISASSQNSSLVIDSVGPRVQSVVVQPTKGQVQVTLADTGSGLLASALRNPNNYSLLIVGKNSQRPLAVAGVQTSPSGAATLTFKGLSRLGNGSYAIQLSAKGLTDVAGNILEERYFIPFPGLYTRSGQNYIAQFDVNGSTSSALRQFVPPPEIAAAKRFRRLVNGRVRARQSV